MRYNILTLKFTSHTSIALHIFAIIFRSCDSTQYKASVCARHTLSGLNIRRYRGTVHRFLAATSAQAVALRDPLTFPEKTSMIHVDLDSCMICANALLDMLQIKIGQPYLGLGDMGERERPKTHCAGLDAVESHMLDSHIWRACNNVCVRICVHGDMVGN